MSVRPAPHAPAHNAVPLPFPQDPPLKAKDYSEGYMYDELDPEDLEVWRGRYATYKQWRHEVPMKHYRPLNMSGSGSTQSLGMQVGVGSADWNWKGDVDTNSDTGTVPTTVVEMRREERDAEMDRRRGLRPQTRQAQTSVPTLLSHGTQTSVAAAPLPSHQSTIRPPFPTSDPTRVPALNRQPSMRQPPVPILAQSIPQPSRARQPTNSSSRYPAPDEAQAPTPVPGTQIVPSPSPKSGHAEREAYLASATDLPLEMLVETQPGKAPSTNTTSKVNQDKQDNLLSPKRAEGDTGRTRNKINPRSQGSAGSSATLPSVKEKGKRPVGSGTTLPSVEDKGKKDARSLGSAGSRRENRPAESAANAKDSASQKQLESSVRSVGSAASASERKGTSQKSTQPSRHQNATASELGRSHTEGVKSKSSSSRRERHYQSSEHLPLPGQETARSFQPMSEVTRQQAAQDPLTLPTATTAQTLRAASTQPNRTLKTTMRSRETTVIPDPAADDHIPASVKAATGGSSEGPIRLPSEATVVQAGKVSIPASSAHLSTKPVQSSGPRTEASPPASIPTSSRPPLVSIPASSATPSVPRRAPTHRQHMALPRPALTPKHSYDGSNGKWRNLDGSLTARFDHIESPENGIITIGTPVAPKIEITEAEHMSASQPIAARQTSQRSARPEDIIIVPATSVPSVTPVFPPPPSHSQTPATNQVPAASVRPPSQAPPTSMRASPLPDQASHHTRSSSGAKIHQPVESSASHPQKHLTVPGSSENGQVVFSPGTESSFRSEDDQISFEVPQGSKRRLRVTLRWLKDGKSSKKGSTDGSYRSDRPPELPPKYRSSTNRAGGNMSRQVSHHGGHKKGQLPPHAEEHFSIPDHPPELDPPPTKNQQGHERQSKPENLNISHDPYRSGATLPMYNTAQVYNMRNMQMPFAYPQPAGAWPYRPMQQDPQMAGSPLRQSEEPPFEDFTSPIAGGDSLPAGTFGIPETTHGAGMGPYQQPYPPGMQMPQQQQRPGFFQRMFTRGEPFYPNKKREDNSSDEDIHRWRRDVPPGRAPTAAPLPRPTMASTFARRPPYFPLAPLLGRTPAVWDRLRYRRQVEEQADVSPERDPPRQRLPDPAPPPRPYTRSRVPKSGVESHRLDRVTPENRPSRNTSGQERQRKEKEDKRRQRASKRDLRDRQLEGQTLRRDVLVKTNERNRPKDLGSATNVRGRSGTMIGDWVSKFGRAGEKDRAPPRSGTQRDYTQWRHRLQNENAAPLRRRPSQPRRADQVGGRQQASGTISMLKRGLSLGRRMSNDNPTSKRAKK